MSRVSDKMPRENLFTVSRDLKCRRVIEKKSVNTEREAYHRGNSSKNRVRKNNDTRFSRKKEKHAENATNLISSMDFDRYTHA